MVVLPQMGLSWKGKEFGANTFENGWAEYVILLVLASSLIKRADLNYGLTSYVSTIELSCKYSPEKLSAILNFGLSVV